MKNKDTYFAQQQKEKTKQLNTLIKRLPPFAVDYFNHIDQSTAINTQVAYAGNIILFLEFLIQSNPVYKNYHTTDFQLKDLDQLSSSDIEEYKRYLKVYEQNGHEWTNGEKGISRKMSALRSFYGFYQKHEYIEHNPTVYVDMPKLHQKEIIRLDPDEVALLLDFIEDGSDTMTKQQQVYHEKNKVRDLAIFTLFLGTGIRVSELVGLDITDVDFKNNSIKVTRKGGNEMFVYFGAEVQEALEDYIVSERSHITPVDGHENALFYSTQRKRITVRAVQNLVSKYSSHITTKHITPHKFRSTYGTTLYKETGDIYLVADVLGHKDVNTTRKHYAAQDDERRRKAATAVTLREK
ncbi:MAG: tyrosine-type recombinase/integrase [Lachnospiraceae bacterium]|jgi:site-specific recombinase XerD|nr:tyrosine-type recombinase/integrase [Lachnospiraceae bacterium]